MKKKKIAFQTFGCKLNFAETSAIARKFPQEAYYTVDFKEEADIYVIHSCTVTAQAEKKCKAAIRQAMRRNPEASVAVIGCYSQVKPDELKKMPGVRIVLGNSEKYNLFDVIENFDTKNEHYGHYFTNHEVISDKDLKTSKTFEPGYSLNDRTRSFFKVQDGCDYFCTYCAIPFARGRSRSASIKETLDVAKQIAATEVKEIVLTGVNIGDFGRQHDQTFYGLVRELNKLEGINRIRISSIEPELLADEIIEMVSCSDKLMPHFHIPLQAGTDRILELMKRKYKREVFAARVMKINELMPHACIAADVITGFPGESDDDFNETVEFIKSLKISYLHVFTYSSRPGTRSAQMEDQITEREKTRRSKVLHELSEVKKHSFYFENKDSIQEVLWESDIQDGMMFGFTGNYIKCKTPYEKAKVNTIEKVKLLSVDRDGIFFVNDVNHS
jgi:threonylcarbamoyladenosine tRNA methylthiotransferase MtaB